MNVYLKQTIKSAFFLCLICAVFSFPAGWALDKRVLSVHDQGWQNFHGRCDLWKRGLPCRRDPRSHQVEWIPLGEQQKSEGAALKRSFKRHLFCLLHSTFRKLPFLFLTGFHHELNLERLLLLQALSFLYISLKTSPAKLRDFFPWLNHLCLFIIRNELLAVHSCPPTCILYLLWAYTLKRWGKIIQAMLGGDEISRSLWKLVVDLRFSF